MDTTTYRLQIQNQMFPSPVDGKSYQSTTFIYEFILAMGVPCRPFTDGAKEVAAIQVVTTITFFPFPLHEKTEPNFGSLSIAFT